MTPRLLCALLSLTAMSAVAADWPQWRGPQRDARAADAPLAKNWPKDGPKLLWKVTDLDTMGVGYGDPSIVGDRLYILGGNGPKKDAQEFCVCLNTTDGKLIWRTPLQTTAGNFNDGWGAGPRSSPTVDGDKLYVLGTTGDLLCLSAKDGKELWRKNLVSDFQGAIPTWGYSESPLVDGDKLLCTPGSKGGLIALNKNTGATIWQCKEFSDGAGYSSMIPTVVGDVRQYVQQTMSSGIGVRAQDGKLLWKVGEIGRKVAVIPSPIVHDNQVFFTSGYSAGCELVDLKPDGNGGTTAKLAYTKSNLMVNHHGGVVLAGDHIYGYSDSKNGWICIDYKKNEEDPVWRSNKLGKGSLIYADGQLYCYAEKDGELARIQATPTEWTETGRFRIPATSEIRPKSGKVWAHPVIANGKLYLRDYDILYCYDLRTPGA